MCLVEPGCYREVHAFTQSVPGGRINVLSLAATEESDASTEFEAAFANRLHVSPTHDATAAGCGIAAAHAQAGQLCISWWPRTLQHAHCARRAAPNGAAAPTAATSSGFAAVSSAGSSRPRDNLPQGSSAGERQHYHCLPVY